MGEYGAGFRTYQYHTVPYRTVIYKFSVPGTSNDIIKITGKLDTVS